MATRNKKMKHKIDFSDSDTIGTKLFVIKPRLGIDMVIWLKSFETPWVS